MEGTPAFFKSLQSQREAFDTVVAFLSFSLMAEGMLNCVECSTGLSCPAMSFLESPLAYRGVSGYGTRRYAKAVPDDF